MSASLRELQRLAKDLHVLRFPPHYLVVEDLLYDELKLHQCLNAPCVRAAAIFSSEHFLEVRGFLKGYQCER